MASWEFAATGPIEARIRILAGDITVDAAADETVTVEAGAHWTGWDRGDPLSGLQVEFSDGRLLIEDQGRQGLLRSRSFDITVRLPAGSECEIDTGAGDVRCNGEFGALRVRSASGDVITSGRVLDQAYVQTASGDVRVESAGTVRAKSVSGDIAIGATDGDALCQTVSGDVEIQRVAAGRIEVKTTSGDIAVGVAPGICVRLDLVTLSGDASSELDDSPGSGSPGSGDVAATVICQSVSGDVLVRRAAGTRTG